MDTGYLREFVTFAGYLNFTAAARALNISQPTLSRHIAELEHQLRCTLVDRNASSLRLTYGGSELLGSASELLALEDKLARHMHSIGNGPQATLVIERYRKSPLVQAFLADVIDEVQRLHPGFSVVRESLHPGDTMGEAVLRGTVDAGIVACTTDQRPACPVGESDGFGVCELPSCQERIFFALPKSNPLAQKPSLMLSDLADCGFVFPLNPEFGRCQPDIAELFETRGYTMKSRPHELEGVENLGLMKLGANEVFIVVESAASTPEAYYLQNPNLTLVPCSDPIITTRYILYRLGDTNPALQAFLDAVRKREGSLG